MPRPRTPALCHPSTPSRARCRARSGENVESAASTRRRDVASSAEAGLLAAAQGERASKIGSTPEQVAKLMQEQGNYQNTLRSKLMKKGGPGY